MQQSVSLVIPTYNRYEYLVRLLTSIKKYANPNEIVIVEQDKNHKDKILSFANSLGLKIKYKYLPERSVSKAVNIGVNLTKSKIILLLDDDVQLKPYLLDMHLKNYADPLIGAVCGRVNTFGENNDKDNGVVGRISNFGVFSNGYSSTLRQEIDCVIGCNTSFRRALFIKVNGFDENFTQNGMRFEADFSLRLKKIGYKIIFDPLATVIHNRADKGGTRMDIDRTEWYFHFFSNEMYFFLKHKPVVFLLPFLFSRTYWIVRCISRVRQNLDLRYLVIPLLGFYNGFKKIKEL